MCLLFFAPFFTQSDRIFIFIAQALPVSNIEHAAACSNAPSVDTTMIFFFLCLSAVESIKILWHVTLLSLLQRQRYAERLRIVCLKIQKSFKGVVVCVKSQCTENGMPVVCLKSVTFYCCKISNLVK